MKRIRRRIRIRVPYGYRLIRRVAVTAKTAPAKIPSPSPMQHSDTQTVVHSPLIAPAVLATDQSAVVAESDVVCFPDNFNPYRDFLQTLPQYLTEMPAEVFHTPALSSLPPHSTASRLDSRVLASSVKASPLTSNHPANQVTQPSAHSHPNHSPHLLAQPSVHSRPKSVHSRPKFSPHLRDLTSIKPCLRSS